MPHSRKMSLTPDLVALCHRDIPDPGPDGRFTPITDEQYRTLAQTLEQESHGEPLWVFAYGSLIWKPEFEAIDRQRATAFGWHRSFCLHINRWRGSHEQPGLMMALERGGRCDGVIYRLPDDDRAAQIERMLRREVSAYENIDAVRWLPVKSESGPAGHLASGSAPRASALSRASRWNRLQAYWRGPAAISGPARNISTTPCRIWRISAFTTATSGGCNTSSPKKSAPSTMRRWHRRRAERYRFTVKR